MKRTIKVQCKFANEKSVLSIFLHSFDLYLKRILAERNGYTS